MLAQEFRLRKSRDIAQVYRRGRFAASGPLTLKVRLNGYAVSRAVVVISKKVAKKATTRNRIRRRLGGQLLAEWQTVSPGYDIVITVRDDISAAPPADLTHHLQAGLRKAAVTTTSK